MKAIVKNNFEFEGQKGHYVGKVRDVYNINDDYLVMVVSDRISVKIYKKKTKLLKKRKS